MCFCSPISRLIIYSTVSWYILIDRDFCTLHIDAVYFFQILVFLILFSLLLCDVLKRFSILYDLKLNQSASETDQNINQAFGNYSVNERTVRRWFAKFRYASKMSPEVVDLQ